MKTTYSLPIQWAFSSKAVMRISLISILLLILCRSGFGQKFTISGFVEDNASSEKLIGANVFDGKSLKGSSANVYGFYSLTLPAGAIQLTASFVGYQPRVVSFNLTSDTTINFSLGGSLELDVFEVTAEQTEQIQQQSKMSSITLPVKTIQQIPALFGERDVLKAIQLLPGVQSGSEGTSGLYVRGGGPDQNLILLDGVPVYNASHLFGFFSVFNPDAINSVELTKGGFPAHHGGRLSSVLDIRMKEGNQKKLGGAGSVGIISSKLMLEGPFANKKGSFIVTGRRTYIDLLARPLIRNSFSSSGAKGVAGYYFYDLNAKLNYKLSDKDRIFISSYMGNDRFYLELEESYDPENNVTVTDKINARLQWGNITTAVRYNRVISNKLFMNITGTFSQYDFLVGQDYVSSSNPARDEYAEDFAFDYTSGIYDWSGKLDFDYIPSANHYIKFGVNETYHTFVPGVNVFQAEFPGADPIDTTFGAKQVFAHEYYAYAEDDIKFSNRLKANLGFHFSGMTQKDTSFFSFQPRISARYLITEQLSLKGSFARMQQYIHLLTNGTIGLPTDLWVPSTKTAIPEQSWQVALGVAKTWRNEFEISIEGYYKEMDNLIEYKEGASFFTGGADWESQIEIGSGTAYGAELFIQKKVGKTTGWIGYTLSWSKRQFDNLNFGNEFPYKFDRRHDIAVVVTHTFNERMDIAATWVYGTGNAISLATERYFSITPEGGWLGETEYVSERNAFRMAAYHRMDVGANFHKEKRWGKRTWSVGGYNIYSRNNPFYLYFDETAQGRVLKQVSLFPIIPYVSYSFEF